MIFTEELCSSSAISCRYRYCYHGSMFVDEVTLINNSSGEGNATIPAGKATSSSQTKRPRSSLTTKKCAKKRGKKADGFAFAHGLLPPLPDTEEGTTSRRVPARILEDPVYREKLERQMEDALGDVEIVDDVIRRCMPEGQKKGDSSSVFAEVYGMWARGQGGRCTVGNVGFTLGGATRAPDAYFYQAGNIPPPAVRDHMLAPTAPPDWILETEFEGMADDAENKIVTFWLANGVQEAWLLVIPDPGYAVAPAPVGPPPPVLPVLPLLAARPASPYLAIYQGGGVVAAGYFAINWHTQFQALGWSLFAAAPAIPCDFFMQQL